MLRVLAWLFGALAVLTGAAVLALLLLDWNALRGPVAELASSILGRKVELGSLDVQPGCTTRIRVTDLRIDNTGWGQAESLFALQDGEVAIRVPPLLTGEREISELVFRNPRIALEKDQEGRINWNILPKKEEPRPKERVALPGRILVEDGRFSYRDAGADLELEGRIATAKGDAAGRDPLRIAARGALEGRPLKLDVTGGPARRLQATQGPYNLKVDLRFGKTSVQADGTLVDPFNREGFNFDILLEGPTLADIFPLFGIPLPDTPPYKLSGDLEFSQKVWHLRKFEGSLGDSTVTGSLTLDQSSKKPYLKADVVSPMLDFDDLAGLIGATPDPEETASAKQKAAAGKAGVFPDTPVSTERLHAMNMDVSFRGEQISAGGLPLEQVRFHVRLLDARAEFNPLSFEMGGGRIAGEVALNGRQEVPSADADLAVENIDLKPLFQETRFVQEMGGRFFGHIYILGVGPSLDAMLASARGGASIAMRDGNISGLMLEAIGLDLAEALGLAVSEDMRVGIRCGRADADIEQGKATLTRFLLDTTDSLLVATGSANLGEETLDLYLEAREKDFSLIDASAPVHVQGSIAAPEVEIGEIEGFPLFEMGDQENIDCERLLGDVVEHRHEKKDK